MQLPPEAFEPVAELDAPPGIDNLPSRPGQFVGRESELVSLTSMFASSGPVPVTVVYGLGGIGKSALVARWAASKAHVNSPILWLTADTASEVTAGLVGFATRLQPALAQAIEADQLGERALQWLATHTGWLLVLDNVEDFSVIAPVLARVGTGGRVLITSRRASGWQPGTAIVRLGVLEPSESLRLLAGLLTGAGPRYEDGAAELCATLGHLPLAIEQAGAYLAQDPFLTPRAYLQLLADYPAQMFAQEALDTDSERTIARIWRITLDRVADIEPAAVELLQTLAWYAPDAIPLALCQIPKHDPLTRSRALGLLAAYSMITPDPATSTVSIHRLVQAVARNADSANPHSQPDAIARARFHAADTLCSDLPNLHDPATWSAWRALLPHVDALASYSITSDVPTADLIATICVYSGRFMADQGLYAGSLAYLHRALTDWQWILGVDHPDTLAAASSLAYGYLQAGMGEEAISLAERTLASQERVLGSDHPETLSTCNNLASAYMEKGRFEEGISLAERTLAARERALGSDHPDARMSRRNLAAAFASVGRLDEAIPLLQRNLAEDELILGPDHPETLLSRSNLAAAHLQAGQVDEAYPHVLQTFSGRMRILGADHPETLTARNNLAMTYLYAGWVDGAILLIEKNLTERERVLGSDHPETLTSRRDLAYAYFQADRLEEAMQLYERTVADRERVLGIDHPDTLSTRNDLATTYLVTGRVDEAIPLYEQTLADMERVLGPDHPEISTTRVNLAEAYQAADRTDEVDRDKISLPTHDDIESG